jgi:uncharacterized protein YbjT (DUF2867 family)
MPKESDLILITGATGKQGGAVAHELLAEGRRVRIMTRHPESAQAKQLASRGAEVVRGDLDEPASLPPALEGAWSTFAVQNTWEAGVEREEEQGLRFADAARKAGVRHYVYSSVASAHRHTGIPHFDNKARVEQRVRELGFPSWAVIRPVFFMENFLSDDNKAAIAQGQLPMGISPTTKLQMIAVADVGKYGKLMFDQSERFNTRSIDVAGDEVTMPEAADVLARVTGHPVRHVQVPISEIRKFSEDLARMLEWFDAVGYDADIEGNAKEFGIRPTRFAEWAKVHVAPGTFAFAASDEASSDRSGNRGTDRIDSSTRTPPTATGG